jgi:hypothetical protein
LSELVLGRVTARDKLSAALQEDRRHTGAVEDAITAELQKQGALLRDKSLLKEQIALLRQSGNVADAMAEVVALLLPCACSRSCPQEQEVKRLRTEIHEARQQLQAAREMAPKLQAARVSLSLSYPLLPRPTGTHLRLDLTRRTRHNSTPPIHLNPTRNSSCTFRKSKWPTISARWMK